MTGAVRASVTHADLREAGIESHTAEVKREVPVRVEHAAIGLGNILLSARCESAE